MQVATQDLLPIASKPRAAIPLAHLLQPLCAAHTSPGTRFKEYQLPWPCSFALSQLPFPTQAALPFLSPSAWHAGMQSTARYTSLRMFRSCFVAMLQRGSCFATMLRTVTSLQLESVGGGRERLQLICLPRCMLMSLRRQVMCMFQSMCVSKDHWDAPKMVCRAFSVMHGDCCKSTISHLRHWQAAIHGIFNNDF